MFLSNLFKSKTKFDSMKPIGQIESGGESKTESGQPKSFKNIYPSFDHPEHKDLTSHEHQKAANVHFGLALQAEKEIKSGGLSILQIRKRIGEMENHSKNADLHRKAALTKR